MRRSALVATWGRLALVVAAFALVAGIVAAPLLERIGSPSVVLASHR